MPKKKQPLSFSAKARNQAIRLCAYGDKGKHEASVADIREIFKALNVETKGAFYDFVEKHFGQYVH